MEGEATHRHILLDSLYTEQMDHPWINSANLNQDIKDCGNIRFKCSPEEFQFGCNLSNSWFFTLHSCFFRLLCSIILNSAYVYMYIISHYTYKIYVNLLFIFVLIHTYFTWYNFGVYILRIKESRTLRTSRYCCKGIWLWVLYRLEYWPELCKMVPKSLLCRLTNFFFPFV